MAQRYLVSEGVSASGGYPLTELATDLDIEDRVLPVLHAIAADGMYLPAEYSMSRMVNVFMRGTHARSGRDWYRFKVSRVLGGLTAACLVASPHTGGLHPPDRVGQALVEEILNSLPSAPAWMIGAVVRELDSVPARSDVARRRVADRGYAMARLIRSQAASEGWDVEAAAADLRLGIDEDLFMGFAYALKLNVTVTEQQARGNVPAPEVIGRLRDAASGRGIGSAL